MSTKQMESILFLDIETVSLFQKYDEIPENMKKFWDKKAALLQKSEDDSPDKLYERAGIYAEFGKIICISVAYFRKNKLRIKSFYGHDEKQLLLEFAALLNNHFNKSNQYLCAHNGKEFDFPYLCRKMLIHKIPIPKILNTSGKKPWETSFLDTMEMWKFGDYKNFTPLDLLAYLFGIDSPKDDINGSMVGQCYWEENDLEKIKTYCQKDTITVAQLYLCYQGKELLTADEIVFV